MMKMKFYSCWSLIPYTSQEINLCEKSFDSNEVDFLDDTFYMLFDEGGDKFVAEIDSNKILWIQLG